MKDFLIFSFKIIVVIGAFQILKVPFNIAIFVIIVIGVVQIRERFGFSKSE